MHIGIRNLRHGRQTEQHNQQHIKARRPQIHPLHIPQPLLIINRIRKENPRRHKGATNDPTPWTACATAGSVESPSTAADHKSPKKGISRRLERGQPGADDEHAPAEPAEGALETGGPEQEAADGEPGHEGHAEAEAAQDVA
jgi:hypothetical protein